MAASDDMATQLIADLEKFKADANKYVRVLRAIKIAWATVTLVAQASGEYGGSQK